MPLATEDPVHRRAPRNTCSLHKAVLNELWAVKAFRKVVSVCKESVCREGKVVPLVGVLTQIYENKSIPQLIYTHPSLTASTLRKEWFQ